MWNEEVVNHCSQVVVVVVVDDLSWDVRMSNLLERRCKK